ncbi:MAG: SDR family NAD(P)-dependent oxidoreductase [Pseudomonadota bacterium]
MQIYHEKVAVVTGAASGIGRALALGLARAGARLALSDVNMAGLAETVRQCGNAEVRSYRLDVSQRVAAFAHADEVLRDFGHADYLFNNAGVALAATTEHSTIEEIEWQLSINLWGVIYLSKAFLPPMLARRSGHIVNLSSVFGIVGFPCQSAYNVSKFGVRGFTECLWLELEGSGVQATTVHPGGIRTDIGTNARLGQHAGAEEADIIAKFSKLLCTPPQQCADAILRGVARGKRRILTGHNARLTDWLARLLPARYPSVLKWILKQ